MLADDVRSWWGFSRDKWNWTSIIFRSFWLNQCSFSIDWSVLCEKYRTDGFRENRWTGWRILDSFWTSKYGLVRSWSAYRKVCLSNILLFLKICSGSACLVVKNVWSSRYGNIITYLITKEKVGVAIVICNIILI